jgi:hypothetical protein
MWDVSHSAMAAWMRRRNGTNHAEALVPTHAHDLGRTPNTAPLRFPVPDQLPARAPVAHTEQLYSPASATADSQRDLIDAAGVQRASELRGDLRREMRDAVMVVADVMRAVRDNPARLDTSLRLELRLPLPEVAVDPTSMRRALLGLVLSALEEAAAAKGAERAIRVSLRPVGEAVEVAVRHSRSFATAPTDGASVAAARVEVMANGGSLTREENVEGEVSVATQWPTCL